MFYGLMNNPVLSFAELRIFKSLTVKDWEACKFIFYFVLVALLRPHKLSATEVFVFIVKQDG